MAWNDFLSGDFGLGLDEDARRQAMRQAIRDAGRILMERASTEGAGAFGAAGSAFFGGYRDHLLEADERRRQQKKDEQDEQYRSERMQSLEEAQEDRKLRLGDRDADAKAWQDEIAARKSALEQVSDQKARGELELRVGQKAGWWDRYEKLTAPEKDAKPPETKTFPDGSLRAWDPDTRDYSRVLGRKPPEENDGPTLGEAVRDIRSKREADVGQNAREAALKRADAEIAEIRKKNAENTAPPVPVPTRLELAQKYQVEEMAAARFAAGMPSAPAGRATGAQAPRPAPEAAKAAPPPNASQAPTATPEQAKQLAALIEKRVAALKLPPTVAIERKAQILARARKALADGVPPDQILAELR